MKTLIAIASLIALSSCSERTERERFIPTTEAERKAVAEHVEKVIQLPKSLSGDDQDLEDVINAAYEQAHKTLCRPSYWETNEGRYSGHWHYGDDRAPSPSLEKSK